MTSASEGNIPSFSAPVVKRLPLYYQAVISRLAETGRAVIKDLEEKTEESA